MPSWVGLPQSGNFRSTDTAMQPENSQNVNQLHEPSEYSKNNALKGHMVPRWFPDGSSNVLRLTKASLGPSQGRARKGQGLGTDPCQRIVTSKLFFPVLSPGVELFFVFCFPKTYSWGLLAGAGDFAAVMGMEITPAMSLAGFLLLCSTVQLFLSFLPCMSFRNDVVVVVKTAW